VGSKPAARLVDRGELTAHEPGGLGQPPRFGDHDACGGPPNRPLGRVFADRQAFNQRHGDHDPPDVTCGRPPVFDKDGLFCEALDVPDVSLPPAVEPVADVPADVAVARYASVSARARVAAATEPTTLAATSPTVTTAIRR